MPENTRSGAGVNLPAVKQAALPPQAVANVADLKVAFERAMERCNLIAPVVQVDHIPAMHRVSMRIVAIDTSPRSPDTYQDTTFCKSDERALTKVGLLKLWQAAGGSVIESRRLDNGKDPNYCHWSVRVRVQQLDGRMVEFVASKEIDLRDGSPQIKKSREATRQADFTAGQRVNLAANAETKALLRAVRGALGIPQKMASEQLARPFVVPALVPDLDTSDPEIRRMIAAKALNLEAALFPDRSTIKALAAPQAETPIEVVEPPPLEEEDIPAASVVPDDPDGPTDDLFEASAPAVLPVPEEVIAQADPQRARYLAAINTRLATLADKIGDARALGFAGMLPPPDLLACPMDQIVRLGQQIKDLIDMAAKEKLK